MTTLARLRVVQEVFRGVAKAYPTLLLLLSWGQASIWRRNVIRLAGVPRGCWAIDVACGPGVLTFDWVRQGAKLVGVDVSTQMLREARRLATGREFKIEWVRAVAEALPFRDGSFAAAAVSLATRNFANVSSAFGEMCRVVRPGGAVIALDFTRPPPGVFAGIYGFYLGSVLPLIGRFISPSWHELLSYLARTIRRALSPVEVAREMADAGVTVVRSFRMTAGAVALVEGRRYR